MRKEGTMTFWIIPGQANYSRVSTVLKPGIIMETI